MSRPLVSLEPRVRFDVAIERLVAAVAQSSVYRAWIRFAGGKRIDLPPRSDKQVLRLLQEQLNRIALAHAASVGA